MQKSTNMRNGKDTAQDYRFLMSKAWKRSRKRDTKKSLDEGVLEYEQMVNEPPCECDEDRERVKIYKPTCQ